MMGRAPQLEAFTEAASSRRESPQLLTVREAAEHFRVQQATIQRWCREGRIQALRTGKSWRIPKDAITSLSVAPEGQVAHAAPSPQPRPSLAVVPAPKGQHFLMLADGKIGLDDVLAPLRLQAEDVTSLQIVRFGLGSSDDGDRAATTSLPKLKEAWDEILGAIGHSGRAVALVDGDPRTAFRNEGDGEEWEQYLTRSASHHPLTIICIRESQWVPGETMDAWARSFAAHDMVWLRSRSSTVSLTPGNLDL